MKLSKDAVIVKCYDCEHFCYGDGCKYYCDITAKTIEKDTIHLACPLQECSIIEPDKLNFDDIGKQSYLRGYFSDLTNIDKIIIVKKANGGVDGQKNS